MLRDERPRQLKLKYNVSSHMWPNISGDELIGSSYEIKTTRKKPTTTITNEIAHTNIKINGNKNKTHTYTHTVYKYIGCFIHNLNMRLHDNNNSNNKEQ